MFDVWVLIAFGAIGLIMRKRGWPATPLILGIVLGRSFESAVSQSLAMSGGSPLIFIQHPITVAFLLGAVAVVALALVQNKKTSLLSAPLVDQELVSSPKVEPHQA